MFDNNIRYVLTKIEKNTHILCVSKCNFCPFFSINDNNFVGYCSKFKKNTEKAISYINIISWSKDIKYTTNTIDIPKWCKLSNMYIDDEMDTLSYTKIDNDTIMYEKVESPEFLPIVFDTSLSYDNGKLVINENFKNNEYEYNPIINNKQICSCCGLNSENVSRDINLGMCDSCYSTFKESNDFDNYQFIYMNNFRLKRKSTYSTIRFKKLTNNIKINNNKFE